MPKYKTNNNFIHNSLLYSVVSIQIDINRTQGIQAITTCVSISNHLSYNRAKIPIIHSIHAFLYIHPVMPS